MLQETLALVSAVPALGLLWVSVGSHPSLAAAHSPSRIANPNLREDDDDLDEDEEEEELEEELEEEELEKELEEQEEDDEEEEEDGM
jgi:hypothetical protein